MRWTGSHVPNVTCSISSFVMKSTEFIPNFLAKI